MIGGSQVATLLVSNGLIDNDAFTNDGSSTSVAELLMNGDAFSQSDDRDHGRWRLHQQRGGTVSGTGQYLFSGTTTNNGSVTGESPSRPIVFFDTQLRPTSRSSIRTTAR